MTNRPTDDEMIAEIERQRAEGTDLEGLIPVHSSRPPFKRRAPFSLRLSIDELKAITEVAQKRGVSIGDFIREAAMKEVTSENSVDREFPGYSINDFLSEIDETVNKLKESYRAS